MSAVLAPPDRKLILQTFRDQRARSRSFFDALAPDVYTARPIPLRNPFVFYEGHLPAFNVNTLVKKGLGRPGVDERLELLFARGIDPEDEAAMRGGESPWPPRDEVLGYADAADALVEDALGSADLTNDEEPLLVRGQAVHTILEHEPMHQETLRYMAHRLPFAAKRAPAGYRPLVYGDVPEPRAVRIPAGVATLGADPDQIPFGWDNEHPALRVEVPAFTIDAQSVTNRDFMRFVEAGGYDREELWSPEGWAWRLASGRTHPLFWERGADGGWLWRGMFEALALPPAWPVWVSGEEAAAYARFSRKRLPTEPEWHRAAFGTPEGTERPFPWGDEPPDPSRGHFGAAASEPIAAGSRPAGASAFGIEDLFGNGWEWTSTRFAGFPGFTPMASYPEYSADFFDEKHWVLKGASPATDATLARRSFRNWFRPTYPYLYAKFRLVEVS